MIFYQAQMLPQVDYQKIEKNFPFSLTYLEHQTMQDCCDFLGYLKSALKEEHLMQVPESLVAHLCAYLGTVATLHIIHQAEKLELSIIDLIKHQAHAAYQHFNRFPINSTIKSHEQKKKNVEALRESAPGSIIAQTMHLGRVMMNMLEELKNHRQSYFKSFHPPKQTDLFCTQETLIKIMLLVSSKKCAEWRGQLNGLSDNYVINQLAIQIGWLIGYFSHLDNRITDETEYFDYGLPLIHLYRKHVYQLMESYANAVHEQEAAQQSQENQEAEALLSEIHCLSEKIHAQISPAFTDFQKHVSLIQAGIEKVLIELLTQGYAIKIIIMSVFYFWFTLETSLHGIHAESAQHEDAFLHMGDIIDLVKKTVRSLPKPNLTPENRALNEKMQLLKRYLPRPEDLDKPPENIEQQTAYINATSHSVISEFIQQNIHLEAITIVLFSRWMRLAVFFGVSESDWQKMDYYLPNILKAARSHLFTT
jgi:hypothetical protein